MVSLRERRRGIIETTGVRPRAFCPAWQPSSQTETIRTRANTTINARQKQTEPRRTTQVPYHKRKQQDQGLSTSKAATAPNSTTHWTCLPRLDATHRRAYIRNSKRATMRAVASAPTFGAYGVCTRLVGMVLVPARRLAAFAGGPPRDWLHQLLGILESAVKIVDLGQGTIARERRPPSAASACSSSLGLGFPGSRAPKRESDRWGLQRGNALRHATGDTHGREPRGGADAGR